MQHIVSLVKKSPHLHSLAVKCYDEVTSFVAHLSLIYYRIKYKSLTPFIIRPFTTDIHVFYSIFVQHELKLSNKVSPSLIIDCGAYIGLSSLYYHIIYPNAKIIAIEPETSNFNQLVANTKRIRNITPVNAAIWPYKKKLYINNSPSKWGYIVNDQSNDCHSTIAGRTLNQVIKMYKKNADYIILKMDIEGAEKDVFSKNNKGWLSTIKIIQIELHDNIRPGCSEAFYNSCTKNEWKIKKKGEKFTAIRYND